MPIVAANQGAHFAAPANEVGDCIAAVGRRFQTYGRCRHLRESTDRIQVALIRTGAVGEEAPVATAMGRTVWIRGAGSGARA